MSRKTSFATAHWTQRKATSWRPGSDFTADQFDWTVVSLVQDNEGGWWARVTASPHMEGYETEQIFVMLSPGMTLWQPFDMGTGIEPEIDDRFPEEIRGEL